MNAKRIDRNDSRALRQFYWLLAGAIAVMFFGVLPWLFGLPRSSWPLYIAGALAFGGSAFPRALYPLYAGWMRLAAVLGWINSRLLLGIAFYLVVLPIGFVARRLGKLQYDDRLDDHAQSYRVTRDEPPAPSDMERPF